MSFPTETIDIQNIVASTDVEQELELHSLAMDLIDADYDPDNFPGVIYQIQEPKATNLIFRSGKIVSTGATSVDDAHVAIRAVCEKLRDLGIDAIDTPEITVQNIVTSADFGTQLNLNAIVVEFGLENIEYEPEQFPELVYQLDTPDIVALLFGSGKVVITGAKNPDAAGEALETIYSELNELGLIDS